MRTICSCSSGCTQTRPSVIAANCVHVSWLAQRRVPRPPERVVALLGAFRFRVFIGGYIQITVPCFTLAPGPATPRPARNASRSRAIVGSKTGAPRAAAALCSTTTEESCRDGLGFVSPASK